MPANVSVDFAGLEARFFDIRGEALAEEARGRVPSMSREGPGMLRAQWERSEREVEKDQKVWSRTVFISHNVSINQF